MPENTPTTCLFKISSLNKNFEDKKASITFIADDADDTMEIGTIVFTTITDISVIPAKTPAPTT